MTLTCAIVILSTSLLALPFSYVLNIVAQGKDQMKIFIVGAVILLLIGLLPQYMIRIRAKPPKVNSFINVLSLLTFNSVMSLTIALENDGLIAEFLGSFLREGEPYLKSAHGTMMCYWDGIVHNAMYLTMMAALSWNQSFHDVGLYWAGSFSQRLVLVFIAVMLGKDSLRWAFLLYCPFIAICIWSLKKFLNEKSEEDKALRIELSEEEDSDCDDSPSKTFPSIWRRPIDMIFILFYMAASVIAIFRFTTAMGPNKGLTQSYVDKIEPYLQDTLPYAKAEIMIQMFYFVPYYAMSIHALVHPGHSWILRWSIIFAGAAGQGQFSYIGSSFHYRTPYIFRVPQTLVARGLFWSINGILLLVPQIMMYKYNHSPEFFLFSSKDEKAVENGHAAFNSKDSSPTITSIISNAKKTE